MNTDWIQNLKVGDKVIVNNRIGRAIRTVSSITPAGNIKLNNNIIYNKDGTERGGDSFNRGYLTEATPEVIKDIKEKYIINLTKKKMKETTNITFEQAQAILKILIEDNKDEN